MKPQGLFPDSMQETGEFKKGWIRAMGQGQTTIAVCYLIYNAERDRLSM